MPWQQKLFIIFFDQKHKSVLRTAIDRFLLGLIAINILALWPMTLDPAFRQYAEMVSQLSMVSYVIFGIEYVLRLLACAGDAKYSGKRFPVLTYVVSFAGLADLLVLLPYLLGLNLDLRILKLARAMQITGALTALTDAYAAFRENNRGQPARKQLYALLHPTPTSGNLQAYIDNFLMFMVLLSVVMIVLESVVSLELKFGREFFILDILAVSVFTLEYIIRIYIVPEDPEYASMRAGRLRFVISYSAMIDLIAIAPFFLAPFVGHLVDLRFMRIFRLVRILKLTRYTSSLGTLRKVFVREAPILGAAGFLMLLLVMLAASLGYLFEHAAQPDKFENIPQSIYWAVVTLASVGYGDISPVTPMGRLMTIVMAIVGLGIFALPAGVLSAAFSDQLHLDRERLNRMVDDALNDDILTDEEMVMITAEAKRLHLQGDEVDHLIKNGNRKRGVNDRRKGADKSASVALPPPLAIGASKTGELIDWKQNPELAFMQLNQLISSAKLVIAASDIEQVKIYFDDPSRSPDHHRQIFSKLIEQSQRLP
jgi:voltage-gated potassium channel Kch